ncbi:MAG: hypothetical protein QOI80_2117 [Solirubrobacteraceae bacterium]|nr:hypothetical protein [Solirubrobacteraceae bacterium]
MSRRTKVTAIAFGTFVFLGISLLLARALVGAGNERAVVLDVLRAQAAGDADGVLALMPRCAHNATCARVTRERTARLRRPGKVEILNYTPSTQAAFVNQTGTARVAWRTRERRFPVVQCVVVKREGPLTGGGMEVYSISNPVGIEAGCR